MELYQSADGYNQLAKTPAARALRLLVLDAIARYQDTYGYSPTIRNVGDELGLSSSHAHQHITELEKRDLVIHPMGRARTLNVTPAGRQFLAAMKESPFFPQTTRPMVPNDNPEKRHPHHTQTDPTGTQPEQPEEKPEQPEREP